MPEPAQWLVVDDEPAVRRVLRRMLEAEGHEVIEAESGAAAVAVVEEGCARIDAAILDAVMPGMSGKDTFEALRALRPSLPMAFASGYSTDALPRDFLDAHRVDVLPKPFRRSQFLAVVARLLDTGD